MTRKYPKFRNKEAEKERARTEFDNWQANRLARMDRRDMKSTEDIRHEAAIRSMTNWQMTQWHRAGRPKNQTEKFARMTRPK